MLPSWRWPSTHPLSAAELKYWKALVTSLSTCLPCKYMRPNPAWPTGLFRSAAALKYWKAVALSCGTASLPSRYIWIYQSTKYITAWLMKLFWDTCRILVRIMIVQREGRYLAEERHGVSIPSICCSQEIIQGSLMILFNSSTSLIMQLAQSQLCFYITFFCLKIPINWYLSIF